MCEEGARCPDFATLKLFEELHVQAERWIDEVFWRNGDYVYMRDGRIVQYLAGQSSVVDPHL